MFNTLSVVLGLASALAGVAALPSQQLADRASSSSSSQFSIFAYGSASDTKIGGYPIFYNSGLAYIANPAKVNYTEDYVYFSEFLRVSIARKSLVFCFFFFLFRSLPLLPGWKEWGTSTGDFFCLFRAKLTGTPLFFFLFPPSSLAKSTSDTTQWIAEPVQSGNFTWGDSILYVPKPYGNIGFYKEGVSTVSTDSIITTGFKTYGNTVMLSIDGTISTQWYAVATDIDGLWSVGWNASGAGVLDAELISLSKGKPFNVNYPKNKH